ncbi:carbohydrate ABC transporter permease [Actinoallomurus sp. CA-150999]|uniref:carbohydrate ABC transporter permease n=1 Tax=Actinoallomurus sp. CA-150999 TaxID=3239887 RepID=UPI003D8C1D0B
MRKRPNVVAGFAAFAWLLIIGVPLYALVNTAIQPESKYTDGGPVSIPSTVTLDNFRTVVHSGFLHYVWNTVLVAGLTVAIVLLLGIPIGYTVVRGDGWLTRGVFRLFLLGLAIPSQAVLIPLFLLINRLGLYDSLWGIALPTAAFALPVSVLVLSGGMRDISASLFEAMALDGARPARILVKLVIPLSRSSITTTCVFTALQAWNGFLFPLVMTQSNDTKLVPLGLYNFVSQYGADVPALLAAVLMSAVPILIVYLFARRALVMGLMGTGGK